MKARRTRLSPDERKDQILDSAKELILEKGLNAFTIDLLAEYASISTPLVYKYYPARLDILQALLFREYGDFAKRFLLKIQGCTEVKDILRVMVEANFEELSGANITFLLKQQPDVAKVLAKTEKKGDEVMSQFVLEHIAKEFGCTINRAGLIATMASAASYAAAEYYDLYPKNKNKLIDRAVNFIWAGLEADTQ